MSELDPCLAAEYDRKCLQFVQAFNGQKFDSVADSVDRRNLATALDNLEEAAAMLLNLSGRVQDSRAAALEEAKQEVWKQMTSPEFEPEEKDKWLQFALDGISKLARDGSSDAT